MKTFSTAYSLAFAYLRERPLATALNILQLGLGVGTIIALTLTLSQTEQSMERDAAGVDLVIGAKGSPLQLVLSTVFQIDIPTGNIALADAADIIARPAVKQAIPLALGDSYKTFRVVGTTYAYVALYGASLQSGRMWSAPLEVVVGADVARVTGLNSGQAFNGSHGLTDGDRTHDDHPYTVVGVLKPAGSVIDRVILTSVESVWKMHEHNGARGNEITAYLIQYATPLAAASFPRMVNANSGKIGRAHV